MTKPEARRFKFADASRAACVLTAMSIMLIGCGDKNEKASSQTAAKVNKEEVTVHQINFLLQQQRGLRPEQADAASKQILERLIDQELALQKASDLKLDRDARVMQQIDAARRDIIARAYVEKLGESAAKPTADEVQKYYDDKPALFRERRVYSLQEIAIEAKPDQFEALRSKLASSANIAEFVEYLKANEFRFNGNQAVRSAEQLPLASLSSIAAMKDGQASITQTPNGAQVLVMAGSRSQPVTLAQATPAIEQFILNERKRELAAAQIKELRSQAKISYVGKFAEGAGQAASAVQVAPAAPAPTASDREADAISKGLGLKK